MRSYEVITSNVAKAVEAYDAMGRKKSVSKTITGNPATYTTLYDYDLSGKLIGTTYPDNYHVTYSFYPGTGLLHTVVGITDFEGYATYSAYEPTGKIGQMVHQNNTTTIYSYDAKSTRLSGLVTHDPTGLPANDVQRIAGDVVDSVYK